MRLNTKGNCCGWSGNNIVLPLEEDCGIRVDVFAAECSGGCPLVEAFRELFSGRGRRHAQLEAACLGRVVPLPFC